jgi:small subunit ribosomal protein S8
MSTLKNAADTGKSTCILEPASKLVGEMLRIMQEYNYVTSFEYLEDGRGGQLKVQLSGNINRCGAISPRYSCKLHELEYWEMRYLPSKSIGILVISTSKGVMTHDQARKLGIGGELLGYVY